MYALKKNDRIMNKYFLNRNGKEWGPYTADELAQYKLVMADWVWREGMENWQQAGQVPELKALFQAAYELKQNTSPPPPHLHKPVSQHASMLPGNVTELKDENRGYKAMIYTVLIVVAVVIGIGAISTLNRSSNGAYTSGGSLRGHVEKSPEELRQDLRMTEAMNPTQYLSVDATMRDNIYGQKVFEGRIQNLASIAEFKDFKIRITYLSKTETHLGSENFVIYEQIGPGESTSIKIKAYVPDATRKFSIDISDATAVLK